MTKQANRIDTLSQHRHRKCRCRLTLFENRMRKACQVPGTIEAGEVAMLAAQYHQERKRS